MGEATAAARTALAAGNRETAKREFLRVLSYAPESPTAHLELARLFRQEKNKTEAIAHYQAVVAAGSAGNAILREYAEFLAEAGELGLSLEVLEKLAADAPKDPALNKGVEEIKAKLGVYEIPSQRRHPDPGGGGPRGPGRPDRGQVRGTPEQRNPVISGSIVAWEDYRNGHGDIYMLNLDTGVVTQVTDTLGRESDPNVDGDILVYFSDEYSSGDIFYYRISTGQTVAVTSGETYERYPSVSGDYIGYESYADPNAHVWVYSISLGVAERASPYSSANQYLHDLSGNRLVYTDDRNGNLDIYMASFAFQREEVLWKTYTGAIYNSSPAVRGDGTIYVGSYQYGSLVAINPNGSHKGVCPTQMEVISSPALSESGRTVYLHSGFLLYAIDADSGDPLWTFDVRDLPAVSSVSPAIGRDGMIYVGSGDTLYAINPNGSESWNYPIE